jgi:A/G-specific adenine glycosylase
VRRTEGYPRRPTGRDAGTGDHARASRASGRRADEAGPAAAIRRPRAIARDLLAWYAAQGRDLPIRRAADPWALLVAEVMSQQTRIDRVGAHWERFIAAYPGPAALAEAPLRDVVRAWSGLGYNRRAVALRDAAAAIVERHGGAVPPTIAELDALPGIGPYTARAVAAIAFGQPVAAVDVNVRRLVERLAGRSMPPREIQVQADRLVDPHRAADWTHAAMDLAATVCRRRAPLCHACPVARHCASRGTAGEDARLRGMARPFPETRRWLRGRLLAEIAAVDASAWHAVEGPRGTHDAVAVREALAGLADDGLVEVDAEGRARVR